MTEVAAQQTTLSEQSRAAIDKWLIKYPADQKQSAVIFALHTVQDEQGGWLTEQLLEAVANYLEMSKIQVLEVATFYSMYDLQPTGKYKIGVCGSISCHLKGSEKIMHHLEDKLGVQPGETTADGMYTLKEVECLGACVAGPVMFLDKTYHENLTPEKIDEILERAESNK